MKRAIVTGGTGLIGRTIASRLSEAGWDVASFDCRPPHDDAPGNRIRHVFCDVGDEASVAEAFARLDWNGLDLLVNNAGQTGALSFDLETTSLAAWNAMIGSHLTGAFLMSRAALPLMRPGASIIMMASTRALMSEGVDFPYAAAKAGLIGLTQSLAVRLGPHVRVNAIAPGWITDETDLREADHGQHPAGRVGRPDDIADAVLYLAGAGFVTGQVLPVDGGMTRKMIYVP